MKVFCSELVTTAKQIKKNTFLGQIYYTKEKSKINFKVGTNIFSGEKEGEKIIFKFTYGLETKFYPWVKFGSNLKGYTLFIPSSTVTNYYLSDYPGWIWGVGGRLLLFPETVVNPAISFDFGYTYSNTKLGNSCLKISELQVAILVGKQFRKFYPYGGFRVISLSNEKDENGEKIRGKNNNFSLFFGFAGKLFLLGKTLFEFAFGDEETLSLGIGLRN